MCMKKQKQVRYTSKPQPPMVLDEAPFTPPKTTSGEIETMRTNIIMETPLIEEAQAITGIKTKTGVIHFALKELVRKKKMKEILKFQGKVDFWPGYEKEMTAAH